MEDALCRQIHPQQMHVVSELGIIMSGESYIREH